MSTPVLLGSMCAERLYLVSALRIRIDPWQSLNAVTAMVTERLSSQPFTHFCIRFCTAGLIFATCPCEWIPLPTMTRSSSRLSR